MTTETQTIPQTALEAFEMFPEGTRAQIINDLIVMSPRPTEAHQRMAAFLISEMYPYVKKNKSGRVYPELDVELEPNQVYEPDIIFVSNENAGIIDHKRIYGAPDLVIEILSPGTAGYDRHEKFFAYQAHGVKEYWLIDVHTVTATGYILENKFFRRIARDVSNVQLNCLDLILNLNDF